MLNAQCKSSRPIDALFTVVCYIKIQNLPFQKILSRAPSRSRKLAYDSLRLASRGFYGGGVSYGGLAKGQHHCS